MDIALELRVSLCIISVSTFTCFVLFGYDNDDTVLLFILHHLLIFILRRSEQQGSQHYKSNSHKILIFECCPSAWFTEGPEDLVYRIRRSACAVRLVDRAEP